MLSLALLCLLLFKYSCTARGGQRIRSAVGAYARFWYPLEAYPVVMFRVEIALLSLEI